MPPTTLKRKLKTFPGPEISSRDESADPEDLVAGGSDLGDAVDESDSEGTPEGDSDSDDAPEAESLSGGRAAADARVGALKRHEEKLQALQKTKNKAREAFIRSTKSSKLPAAEGKESEVTPGDADGESNKHDVGEEGVVKEAPRSDRLPDSIFTAAHESVQESIERKRAKGSSKKGAPAKRRRVREAPAERVVNGRTLRVAADINAPPAISSPSTRKAKNSAKGGSAFRRKWKKVDGSSCSVL